MPDQLSPFKLPLQFIENALTYFISSKQEQGAYFLEYTVAQWPAVGEDGARWILADILHIFSSIKHFISIKFCSQN
jgi:hypothetical protein